MMMTFPLRVFTAVVKVPKKAALATAVTAFILSIPEGRLAVTEQFAEGR